MRAQVTALFLAGLWFGGTGLGAAWAESPTQRPPAGRLEQQAPGPAPVAPPGHRQPQAKDLPPEDMPPADAATRDLDKALAKKLTICRGC
jgi:hypothetical protein